jgi:hypothetical protein
VGSAALAFRVEALEVSSTAGLAPYEDGFEGFTVELIVELSKHSALPHLPPFPTYPWRHWPQTRIFLPIIFGDYTTIPPLYTVKKDQITQNKKFLITKNKNAIMLRWIKIVKIV